MDNQKVAIGLGMRVRDIITGFEGIAVAMVVYLTGCTQFGVAPTVVSEGKILDTHYFDVTRLEYVDEGIAERFQTAASSDVLRKEDPDGPDMPPPTSYGKRY